MYKSTRQAERNLYLIWAGAALGVSMLATPAKFLAPDLTLAHALQVGRVTFRVLSIAEVIFLFAALALAAISANPARRRFIWPLIVGAILVVQYWVMLPIIATHTDAVMSGQQASSSNLHSVYVVVEVAKIALLLWLGIRGTADPNS